MSSASLGASGKSSVRFLRDLMVALSSNEVLYDDLILSMSKERRITVDIIPLPFAIFLLGHHNTFI